MEGPMSRLLPGREPRTPSIVTPACGSAEGRCEVGDALRLVAKAHVLDVLHLLSQGRPLRFNELRDATRVKASVLSTRLKDLVEAGFIERRESNERLLRVEYEATRAGSDLLDAIAPLRAWGARHAPTPVPSREGAIPFMTRG